MSAETTEAPKVVTLSATAQKRNSEKKWGLAVMKRGFCVLPAMLLRAQRRLGLSPTQLALIIQLCDFWWDHDKLPWPKKETLAQRMGITDKQVQRLVRELEARGYVKRIKRSTAHGRTSNAYDLSGLVRKLQELEPQFTEAAEASRKVERRGGLKSAAA